MSTRTIIVHTSNKVDKLLSVGRGGGDKIRLLLNQSGRSRF